LDVAADGTYFQEFWHAAAELLPGKTQPYLGLLSLKICSAGYDFTL